MTTLFSFITGSWGVVLGGDVSGTPEAGLIVGRELVVKDTTDVFVMTELIAEFSGTPNTKLAASISLFVAVKSSGEEVLGSLFLSRANTDSLATSYVVAVSVSAALRVESTIGTDGPNATGDLEWISPTGPVPVSDSSD